MVPDGAGSHSGFFSNLHHNPLDLNRTDVALFMTGGSRILRADLYLLAGTGAFLALAGKNKTNCHGSL
jgi:hypothetical protein